MALPTKKGMVSAHLGPVESAAYYEVFTSGKEEGPYERASALPLRLPDSKDRYRFDLGRLKPGTQVWFEVRGYDLRGRLVARSNRSTEEAPVADSIFAESDSQKKADAIMRMMRKVDPHFAEGGADVAGLGHIDPDGKLHPGPGMEPSEMDMDLP